MARVLSNYARLILTFILGVIIVRVMAEIGAGAVLIYLLLVSSTGIAAMFKTALLNALVPALGLSIDGKGAHAFPTVLWTGFVAGIAAGCVSLLLFWVFWLFSGKMNFGDLSQNTITVALAATAFHSFASSVGTVYLNLVLVDRKIVRYNIILIVERAAYLLAALIVLFMPEAFSIDIRLQWFYLLTAGFIALLQLVTYYVAVRGRPEFRLRRAPLSRQTTAWIGKFIWWNAVVVIAFALFTRWPPLIVNWYIGEAMTLTIMIVLTLVGYQRQLAMGLVIGLDAAVARMMGGDGQASAKALMLQSTYMLSVFSTFSVVGIGLMAEPILSLWFGDTLAGSGWTPDFSAELFHIMSFGIAASILSEGWMKFLSGRGEVAAYAPHLIVAGCINALGTIFACVFFQGETALRVIAYIFSASFLVVNLGFIAVNLAQRAEVPMCSLMTAIALPALAAAIAATPGLLLYQNSWTNTEAALAIVSLGIVGIGMIIAMPRVLRRINI